MNPRHPVLRALALLALLALAATPLAARAPEPSEAPLLGASLTPAPVFYESDGALTVVNRSTVSAAVHVQADDGWSFGPDFVLMPGERRALTPESVGTGPTEAVVLITAVAVTGQQQGHLALGTELRPGERPEPSGPDWPSILGVLVVIGLVVYIVVSERRKADKRREAWIRRRMGLSK